MSRRSGRGTGKTLSRGPSAGRASCSLRGLAELPRRGRAAGARGPSECGRFVGAGGRARGEKRPCRTRGGGGRSVQCPDGAGRGPDRGGLSRVPSRLTAPLLVFPKRDWGNKLERSPPGGDGARPRFAFQNVSRTRAGSRGERNTGAHPRGCACTDRRRVRGLQTASWDRASRPKRGGRCSGACLPATTYTRSQLPAACGTCRCTESSEGLEASNLAYVRGRHVSWPSRSGKKSPVGSKRASRFEAWPGHSVGLLPP